MNRRTVVDQTTNEVEKLRRNLKVAGLTESLKDLCAIPLAPDQPPLAISTLRGQFADNREWSADPARPAVIVGTVDMIGSRLLFSGYRVGFKGKPLHAGFLGQDVLLVHDEAHLEPAFQDLLVEIQQEQDRCNEFRRFSVMALTATARDCEPGLELGDDDKSNPVVQERIGATKKMHLVKCADENKLADQVADLALSRFGDSKSAVLIFVRKVDDVEKIVKKLPKESVEQLTGTLRGKERDELMDKPIFRRFLPDAEHHDETAYLVCTSAGEVGVNLSADHLVCDLTTFESMAQRFGRVNRFGKRKDTEIHVVVPKDLDEKDAYQLHRRKTLELLRELDGDASPAALGRLDAKARQDAFAPTPTILPVTDILLDSWSMTTVRDNLPGRPPVEPFLHGISEWEPAQTYVAWRDEVGLDLLDRYHPADLLQDYPLKPHELLRERSDRAFKHFQTLAKRHPNETVWLVDDQGIVDPLTMVQLADKNNKNCINYVTVLLPPKVGGFRNGLLDGTSETANDVADDWFADKERTIRRRIRLWDDKRVPDGMRLIRTIDTDPNADERPEDETQGRRFWHCYELPRAGETEGSQAANKPVSWQTHTDDVVAHMRRIVEKLPLAPELRGALILAAKFHDSGKKRILWQRDIGNPNPENWLAKSGGRMRPRNVTAYRHEFGSLFDVEAETEFQHLSDEMKDIVLQLIAAHHGRARPHFPVEEVFDPEPNGKDPITVANEVPRRFAKLQRKYGRWGLAYLESLLRAADYAASANPSAFLEEVG